MTKEEAFVGLGQMLGTDKVDHGYMKYYAETLPNACVDLLEIGCLQGASMRLWRGIFGPSCNIHTIDLFSGPGKMSVDECNAYGFIAHKGDQSDTNFLYGINSRFDIVIDDGSHNAKDQLISFRHLFQHNLKRGGRYYVEDCHCNLESFYWSGLVNRFEDTIMGMFKNYKLTNKIINPYFNESDAIVFPQLIRSVEILSEKLILINKN
jgi:hypothetical protein